MLVPQVPNNLGADALGRSTGERFGLAQGMGE
jgi:hypothetical protein